jgi:hypothetical protein
MFEYNQPQAMSFIASTDMDTAINRVVEFSGLDKITMAAAGEGIGVLGNKPKAGEHAKVLVGGVVMARVGAASTVGSYAIAAASGWAIPTVITSVANAVILGKFLTSTASGMLAALWLNPFRLAT